MLIPRLAYWMLVVILAPGFASAAMAQDGPARAKVWGAAGIGAGLPASGGDGIANMAELVYQRRPHHVAIRGLVLHDLERNTRDIGELGVLYGRTPALAWGHVAVGAGISGVAFDACPDDDDSCFTFGVPLVVETASSGRFAGVGIQVFGNVNSKASYLGAVIFLQLGRLR